MIPILPCRALDEAIPFYEALGFTRTYRQDRPNPYAAVERDGIDVHLCGIDGFDPADSYGSVIIQVADPDELYRSFAAGLRAAYGKLPAVGIPRIVRPRKRQGTVYGFTVIDPGGNWLRISQLPTVLPREAQPEEPQSRLARVIDNAARQGDSHGDEQRAIRVLTAGLDRHQDAPDLDRFRALLYRAELAARTGDRSLAETSLAAALTIELDPVQRNRLADEVTETTRLVTDLEPPQR